MQPNLDPALVRRFRELLESHERHNFIPDNSSYIDTRSGLRLSTSTHFRDREGAKEWLEMLRCSIKAAGFGTETDLVDEAQFLISIPDVPPPAGQERIRRRGTHEKLAIGALANGDIVLRAVRNDATLDPRHCSEQREVPLTASLDDLAQIVLSCLGPVIEGREEDEFKA